LRNVEKKEKKKKRWLFKKLIDVVFGKKKEEWKKVGEKEKEKEKEKNIILKMLM
jgi:hypothetical protein